MSKAVYKLIAAHVKRVQAGDSHDQSLRSSVYHRFLSKAVVFVRLAITPEFIAEQNRLPVSRRNLVYCAQKLGLRDTVVQLTECRNDEYGRSILNRIQPVQDLVVADAQYHLKCMKKLYSSPKREGKKRRSIFF